MIRLTGFGGMVLPSLVILTLSLSVVISILMFSLTGLVRLVIGRLLLSGLLGLVLVGLVASLSSSVRRITGLMLLVM